MAVDINEIKSDVISILRSLSHDGPDAVYTLADTLNSNMLRDSLNESMKVKTIEIAKKIALGKLERSGFDTSNFLFTTSPKKEDESLRDIILIFNKKLNITGIVDFNFRSGGNLVLTVVYPDGSTEELKDDDASKKLPEISSGGDGLTIVLTTVKRNDPSINPWNQRREKVEPMVDKFLDKAYEKAFYEYIDYCIKLVKQSKTLDSLERTFVRLRSILSGLEYAHPSRRSIDYLKIIGYAIEILSDESNDDILTSRNPKEVDWENFIPKIINNDLNAKKALYYACFDHIQRKVYDFKLL